jgi:PEGA domain
MKRLLFVLAIFGASVAQATPNMRVALMPLRDVGLGAEAVSELEHELVEAVAALPGFSVANLSSAGRLTGPKGVPVDTPAVRAQALAKEVNANRALLVDVARLGDGQVLYLQGIDPKSGEPVGSTTASLANTRPMPAADRASLRGAVVRVLDPAHYSGRLILKLDVRGAEVQIDGRPLAGDTTKPIDLAVGTHALRVTHPAYHDFLRFIEVAFDEPITLDVPLAAYPLSEAEMAERQRRSAVPLVTKKLPWYRTWWALTLSGIVLTGVTTGIVFAARPDITADRSLHFRYSPTP